MSECLIIAVFQVMAFPIISIVSIVFQHRTYSFFPTQPSTRGQDDLLQSEIGCKIFEQLYPVSYLGLYLVNVKEIVINKIHRNTYQKDEQSKRNT
jgi:hypothetical protein